MTVAPMNKYVRKPFFIISLPWIEKKIWATLDGTSIRQYI
jgi:hypothetical protein